MDYQKSYLLFRIGLLLGLFVAAIGSAYSRWMWLAGLVIVLASFMQAALFYQCPHCHQRLNLRTKKPHFCPECGGELK